MNQPTWRSHHPSNLRVALVGALLAGTVGIASKPTASASAEPAGKVTICHATGSASNPYVQITINQNAVQEGRGHNRDGHQSGEDIIPPGPHDSDGRNWDLAGQTVVDEGCLTFAPDILPPSR